MHPALYKSGKIPAVVKLPSLDALLGLDYAKLEDNILGEFGWQEVFKQFLDEKRATPLAAAWEGDRYLVFEQKKSKRLVLVTHLRLAGEEQTARFFGQYSEALEKKHPDRDNLFRRPDFFAFRTPDGDVFLRCVAAAHECITVEGSNRTLFDAVNKSLGFPPVDGAFPDSASSKGKVTVERLAAPVAQAGF
jgi:hypothetical protein